SVRGAYALVRRSARSFSIAETLMRSNRSAPSRGRMCLSSRDRRSATCDGRRSLFEANQVSAASASSGTIEDRHTRRALLCGWSRSGGAPLPFWLGTPDACVVRLFPADDSRDAKSSRILWFDRTCLNETD